MARLLLIEDDRETVRALTRILGEAPERFAVADAPSMRAGLETLADEPVDCVLLDYRLQDADGLACLREIRARRPDLPVVVMTGWGSEEIAVEAMRLGAANYLVKHGRWLGAVPAAVREAIGRHVLADAARPDGGRPSTGLDVAALLARFAADGIVGRSAALARALDAAERAAASSAPLLVEGETGTGKELVARAVHRHGPRAQGAFVAVNCAALPEALLEDELFGHVRGAFTGALASRPGLFETAAGGTLFLDEVGETSASMQAKLLRVLQDGQVRPVGADAERVVDVRVVAATNRPLAADVRQGRFRADLYYRLAVLHVSLPPLRARREDVRPLAEHVLARIAARTGASAPKLAPASAALLEQWHWPGNVRELEGVVERLCAVVEPGATIAPELLDPEIRVGAPPATEADDRPLREIVRCVESAAILARLRRLGGRRTAAARSLGVTREWLWAKMKKLGLAVPADDEEDDA